MAALVRSDDDRRAEIEGVRFAVRGYEEVFLRLVELQTKVGLTENDGLTGALRRSVHEVEATLEAHRSLETAVLMLQMRRHEKDFFARHDVKYRDQLTEPSPCGAISSCLRSSSVKSNLCNPRIRRASPRFVCVVAHCSGTRSRDRSCNAARNAATA